MNDESKKPVQELAKEYLSVLENGTDREQLDAAKREVAELRERHERFIDRYGESDPATDELHGRLEDAEQRAEELEEEHRLPEELEKQLLQRAKTFLLDDEWLHPTVLEALNRALVGEESTTLIIEEHEIEADGDGADIDGPMRFDLIDIVRQLALDKLGESSDVSDWWGTLEGTTKERPFRIVAELGSADPDKVLERLDEDDLTRETVRNRLKNATKRGVNPYIRRDGVYHLSTVGEYLSTEYAAVSSGPAEEDSGSDSGMDDGQATLNQTSPSEGGDSDE